MINIIKDLERKMKCKNFLFGIEYEFDEYLRFVVLFLIEFFGFRLKFC